MVKDVLKMLGLLTNIVMEIPKNLGVLEKEDSIIDILTSLSIDYFKYI
jgi:hypothetical protein